MDDTDSTRGPALFDSGSGTTAAPVYRYQGGVLHEASEDDWLAQEMPLALEYNGISHATVLATPCDLEDLALGFSLTEGIIRGPGDLHDLELVQTKQGLIAQITIANACLAELKQRRRTLAGRTGCGLCGLESLDDVQRTLPPVDAPVNKFTPAAIVRGLQNLKQRQPLHQQTGATHAAAWADRSGEILHLREDVGRHNALDKLIGVMKHRRSEQDTADGFVMISSRASFEMVQKAASVGIPVVVAVSAPTHYAVQTANALGVMLIGFARGPNFTVYSHPEYLSQT